MIEIRSITHLKPEDLQPLITGYTSTARYAVHKIESEEKTVFTLELEPRETPYVTHDDPMDQETIQHYTGILAQDWSLGAYAGDQLVGIALTEKQTWSNRLWVWEFRIAESHRGQGIGSMLMETVAQKGSAAGLRAIFLETQTTNVPAIRFYRKAGFTLDGIELSMYSNNDWPDGEMALFMKRVL
jgi:streptothricin acetyltransferase